MKIFVRKNWPIFAFILAAAGTGSWTLLGWAHDHSKDVITDATQPFQIAQSKLNLKFSYDMELMRAKAEIVRLRVIKQARGLSEDQADELERQINNKKHYQGLLRDMKS